MNHPRKAGKFLTVSLLAAILLNPGSGLTSDSPAASTGNSSTQSGELYLPSDDPRADVARAVDAARELNQLVLLVMGANWCHDSRALASRLHQEPLETLISQNYQVVFVDVGFLEKGRDVINSFGLPVYYATPTVLILDPESGVLVNAENRHQWGNADTISMEDSLEYFQLMASAGLPAAREEESPSAELQSLLAEIDAFEQEQAERLYAAYSVIGPMLKAYKEGNEPEYFETYWIEVRQFRMKVPADLDALRFSARQRISAGESGISLEYPEYPAFTWEENRTGRLPESDPGH